MSPAAKALPFVECNAHALRNGVNRRAAVCNIVDTMPELPVGIPMAAVLEHIKTERVLSRSGAQSVLVDPIGVVGGPQAGGNGGVSPGLHSGLSRK